MNRKELKTKKCRSWFKNSKCD